MEKDTTRNSTKSLKSLANSKASLSLPPQNISQITVYIV